MNSPHSLPSGLTKQVMELWVEANSHLLLRVVLYHKATPTFGLKT